MSLVILSCGLLAVPWLSDFVSRRALTAAAFVMRRRDGGDRRGT
jgi:hypothetical protein